MTTNFKEVSLGQNEDEVIEEISNVKKDNQTVATKEDVTELQNNMEIQEPGNEIYSFVLYFIFHKPTK